MIGFILLLIFLVLFAKALVETFLGGCLIIWGVICQAFGLILLGLANLLDYAERLKKERRRSGTFSHCFTMKTTIALIVTLLASSLVGVSQEPGKPAPEKTSKSAASANTLPAPRTITDTKGRAMEGVIVSKTDKAITFERSLDKKRFEIALDSLSDTDKAFVAGLVEPPVKKLRVIFFAEETADSRLAEKKIKEAGFDIQVEKKVVITQNIPGDVYNERWPILEKLSDDEIKAYDVIWMEASMRDRRINNLLPTYNGVMVANRINRKLTRETFIKPKPGEQTFGAKSFVKVDGNLILFSSSDTKWNSKTSGQESGEPQPERIDEVITAIKTLQAGAPPR